MAGRMDVTVLLSDSAKGRAELTPPRIMDVPVFAGVIKGARGHLGAFELNVEGFAAAVPSSRQTLRFAEGGQDGVSECDLILDLRGGTALFPAPEERDGYFNPDPGNPALVQKALFDIADMVGEFDKPRYVDFDASLCAHSRAGLVGCKKLPGCLPNGSHRARRRPRGYRSLCVRRLRIVRQRPARPERRLHPAGDRQVVAARTHRARRLR